MEQTLQYLEALRQIVRALERRLDPPPKSSPVSLQTDEGRPQQDDAERLSKLRMEYEVESNSHRKQVDKLLHRATDLERENVRLIGLIRRLRDPSSGQTNSPKANKASLQRSASFFQGPPAVRPRASTIADYPPAALQGVGHEITKIQDSKIPVLDT